MTSLPDATPPATATLPAPVAPPSNAMGRAAFVLAVLALLSCWFVLGGLVGIVAAVLGTVAWSRARRGRATNGGLALAAALMGLAAAVIAGLIIAGLSIFYLNHRDDIHSYQDCKRVARTAQDRSDCLNRFKNSLTGG
jgi:hypothetical protein